MKILWHSNANFVDSGYGVQTNLVTRWLAQRGHEVIISAFHGLRGASFKMNGITVLPGSNEQWGNDILVGHYDFYRPDVLFCLMDSWVLRDEILDAVPTAVWTPIDHHPLPPAVAAKLTHIRWPIAMSKHGEAQMRQVMVDPFYVPHMVDTNVFHPVDRDEARAAYGVTDNRFTVVTVAANKGYPTRKNLDRLLKAWSLFLHDCPDGLLYIHTTPIAAHGGLDLFNVADFYGLKAYSGRLKPGETLDGYNVAFPDIYHLLHGDFGDRAMNNTYNMADAFLLPSAGGGFEIPLIEAQAAGTPVLTTAFTAMKELSEVGYAIPVDPIDDMIYTLQESEQALPKVSEIVKALQWAYEHRGDMALRSKAREFAMQYDVDRVMSAYMYPVLETIALGTGDYMRFQEYRRGAA